MPNRPTIKTIASDTGYSIATVSKALNGSSQVRENTREKILASAKRYGFELNQSGVQLRTGKSYKIAYVVISADPSNQEWSGVSHSELLSGIDHALAETPYQVTLHQVADYKQSLESIKAIVTNRKADGIIFPGTYADDRRIQYLLDCDFPFVTYGMSGHSRPHAYVDTNNKLIVSICMQRLIAKKHRRIALLEADADLMHSIERHRTYKRILEQSNLPYDAELVKFGQLTAAFGREKFFELSSLPNPPTAYSCANEAVALGVLSGFHARGYVHGRDAVINATDDLNISHYFTPPITTCYLPISRPSLLLGEFMLRRLNGEPPEKLQQLLMPDLIERCSDILE